MHTRISITLSVLFLCAQSLLAQTGTRPDTTELSLLGLRRETEAVVVVRVLGRPDSVRLYEHPNDVGSEHEWLFFRNVIVLMGPDGGKDAVKLIGPGFATRRGLAVGDSVGRALELYGAPDERSEAELRWHIVERYKPRFIVEVRRGKVSSIYAGYATEELRRLPNKPPARCVVSRGPITLRSTDKVAAAASGTVRFSRATDSAGRAVFDVSVAVRALPAVASLGAYTGYVVWVAYPSLEHIRNLGAIANDRVLTARVAVPNMLFLVSPEPHVTGDSWTGPIVLAGRCP